MDVQDAPLPAEHESLREYAHEAGAGDIGDVVTGQPAVDLGFESVARGIGFVVDHGGGDPELAGDGEAAGFRAVRQDEDDFRRIGRVAGSTGERLHVGAAARNQDADAGAFHAAP